jgi:hypothetical protein
MYLQNKYTRIYFLIIERAKLRTIDSYTESHHIIPKSLGGTDSASNLVNLTSKEHFIAHRLLTKMTEGESKRKMCYAMKIMTTNKHSKRYVPTSRTFEYVREQARQAQIGIPLSTDRKNKIREARKLQITTEETRIKMSLSRIGKKHSSKTIEKMKLSSKLKPPMSEETKIKIKEARAKQVILTLQVTCPHCGKIGGNRIMPRYHFNNCKHK